MCHFCSVMHVVLHTLYMSFHGASWLVYECAGAILALDLYKYSSAFASNLSIDIVPLFMLRCSYLTSQLSVGTSKFQNLHVLDAGLKPASRLIIPCKGVM